MIKGYASSKKDDGSENAFATVEPIREEQHGQSVLAHMTVVSIASETSDSSAPRSITTAGTVAKKGDVIQILTGTYANREVKVESVISDVITLCEKIDIGAGEDYEILRHKYVRVNSSGQMLSSAVLSPAAVKFNKNAVLTDVSEDTGTPANSVPLPVKVLKADGSVPDFATQTTLASLLTELQLKADLTETQPVSVASLPLPSGAATAANQATEISGLAAILSELQQKADLADTQPVSVASLPLPSGASTEATLAALNAKVTAVDTGAVVVSSSALPTGAASETTLAALLTELQLKADLTETQPVSAASLPLPTGASTEATLAALSAKFSALGQNTMANSAPVVIASNQTAIPTTPQGGDIADSARKATGTVTNSAWTELIASTAAAARGLCIFDSSGYSLELGVGGSGSEVRKLIIPPGGLNGFIPLSIPSGSRVSVRALGTTADYTSAELLLTLLQ